MYRLKLVIGLRKKEEKVKGKLMPRTFGAIAAMEVLDKNLTEMLNPNEITKAMKTDSSNSRLDHDTIKYFNDLTIPQIFQELRSSFQANPVNSNADILVSIGTKNKDDIQEFIPRKRYLEMTDSDIVRFFLAKIQENPKLNTIIRN